MRVSSHRRWMRKRKLIEAEFPQGTEVHSCNHCGASEWTVSAKIETKLASGESKCYFLKVLTAPCLTVDHSQLSVRRIRTRSNHAGRRVPFHERATQSRPRTCSEAACLGQLNVSSPDTYYFLCDFIEMASQPPDPTQLCAKLVELHRSSKSPTNMFGFHVTPCRGNLPLQTSWNLRWADFYIQLLRGSMRLDQQINGTWKNLEQLVEQLATHVVPQVLGPLEAEGRTIKPSLIHGGTFRIASHL